MNAAGDDDYVVVDDDDDQHRDEDGSVVHIHNHEEAAAAEVEDQLTQKFLREQKHHRHHLHRPLEQTCSILDDGDMLHHRSVEKDETDPHRPQTPLTCVACQRHWWRASVPLRDENDCDCDYDDGQGST